MAQQAVTLITGASSGIGAALAHVFAAHGHDLALSARSERDLAAVADAIAATGRPRPHVLPADLGRPDGVDGLVRDFEARGLEPDCVVNNAGFGLVGAVNELDRTAQLAMIDLNVRALTDLSLRWIDTLTRHRGGILNVASVAGFMPGPGMAVYYATKAYVVSFSQALNHELKDQGVRVTALCPGPVPTRFQERANMGEVPMASLLEQSAEDVARAGYDALAAGKRLVIPGVICRTLMTMTSFAPTPLVLRMGDARGRQRVPQARNAASP